MAKRRDKNSERNKLADYAMYVALRVVQMTVQSWPPALGIALANALGDIFFLVDKKHRNRAIHNLRHAFPEKSDAWRWEIARRSLRNEIFTLGIEFLFTTRKIRLGAVQSLVSFENFEQTLDLMIRNEKGLIVLTGHFGNWEVLNYVMATLGLEMTAVARPLNNPYIYDFVIGVRERQGAKIIAKKGMTEIVQKAIEEGEMVGFTADQDAGKKGVFVDFFNRKASCYKSIGLLAMQYQLPVVIGFGRRTEGKYHFTVGTTDVIFPEEWRDEPDPLAYITRRYCKSIEDTIRIAPAQYLWFHRRWKTRPKGEVPEPYD